MFNTNQQTTENGKCMCNHNYMDINNTLIGVPKFKMVTPHQYYLKCQQCGDIITINRQDIDNIQNFMHTFF
jgi:Fe2+ or Zn2+ uptake regulation protein